MCDDDEDAGPCWRAAPTRAEILFPSTPTPTLRKLHPIAVVVDEEKADEVCHEEPLPPPSKIKKKKKKSRERAIVAIVVGACLIAAAIGGSALWLIDLRDQENQLQAGTAGVTAVSFVTEITSAPRQRKKVATVPWTRGERPAFSHLVCGDYDAGMRALQAPPYYVRADNGSAPGRAVAAYEVRRESGSSAVYATLEGGGGSAAVALAACTLYIER